jgi:HK97 family phage prohead protease
MADKAIKLDAGEEAVDTADVENEDEDEERVDAILTDQVIEAIDGGGKAEPAVEGVDSTELDMSKNEGDVSDDPNEEDDEDEDNPLVGLPEAELGTTGQDQATADIDVPAVPAVPAVPDYDDSRDMLAALRRSIGELGEKEIRTFKLDTKPEVRASGAGADQFTVKGHAAVFNVESLDLGYFTERIHPAAFDRVLTEEPDVFLNWDHDMRYVFSRTKNGSLELETDSVGLAYWGRIAPVTYAADLRVLLEGEYIDQASFCFTVKEDEWRIFTDDEGNEIYERTIIEIGELFDVCITAMGAYPQTDSGVARAYFRSYAQARQARQAGIATKLAEARIAADAEPTTLPGVAEAIAANPDLRAAKLRAAKLRARAKADGLNLG